MTCGTSHSGMLVVALSALVGLGACNGQMYWPYSAGMVVEGTEVANTTSISYKLIAGEEPVEQTGTIGVAALCSDAGSSTGTRTATTDEVREIRLEVMGNTRSDHPLVPGADKYGGINISVVFEEETVSGTETTVDTYRDPEGDIREWTETTQSDLGSVTTAIDYGVAVDEYYVRLDALDLWQPVDDAQTTSSDGVGDTGFVEVPAPDQSLSLMTMKKPGKGDIWTSLDGSHLYRKDAVETLAIGGKNTRTDRVQVFTTGNVDPTAATLIEQCLDIGVVEGASDYQGVGGILTNSVSLDSGCVGEFTHQQVGTEWWDSGVLMASQLLTYSITVEDYGYEWYEADATANICTRQTSAVANPDEDAVLFIQYTVTTTESAFLVNSVL